MNDDYNGRSRRSQRNSWAASSSSSSSWSPPIDASSFTFHSIVNESSKQPLQQLAGRFQMQIQPFRSQAGRCRWRPVERGGAPGAFSLLHYSPSRSIQTFQLRLKFHSGHPPTTATTTTTTTTTTNGYCPFEIIAIHHWLTIADAHWTTERMANRKRIAKESGDLLTR